MNQENLNQILAYLEKLGEKLGVGVNAIWPWFMKQVYITCIESWVLLILSSIASIIITRGMVKVWFIDERWLPDHDKWQAVRITALCISLLLFAVGILMVLCHGFDFLNPEYAAFKEIIELATPNK